MYNMNRLNHKDNKDIDIILSQKPNEIENKPNFDLKETKNSEYFSKRWYNKRKKMFIFIIISIIFIICLSVILPLELKNKTDINNFNNYSQTNTPTLTNSLSVLKSSTNIIQSTTITSLINTHTTSTIIQTTTSTGNLCVDTPALCANPLPTIV